MKAYRFFSNPGHIVSDGNTGLPMFKFDENGEYVTLDTGLAKRMGPHFQHEEIELVEVSAQVVETRKIIEEIEPPHDEEPMSKEKILSFLDSQPRSGGYVEDNVCPTCGFKAASPSGLVNHMRKHREG